MNNDWKMVDGFSNMGDDDESVVAKVGDDGVTSIVYSAYGGLKLIELTGITKVTRFDNSSSDFSVVISECGDDWEVAFPAVCGDVDVIVVIDDNSYVTLIPMGESSVINVEYPTVVSAEEYDADECENLPEEVLNLFHVM